MSEIIQSQISRVQKIVENNKLVLASLEKDLPYLFELKKEMDFSGAFRINVESIHNSNILRELQDNETVRQIDQSNTIVDFNSKKYLSIIDDNVASVDLVPLIDQEINFLVNFLKKVNYQSLEKKEKVLLLGAFNQLKNYILSFLNAVFCEEKKADLDPELALLKDKLINKTKSIIIIFYNLLVSDPNLDKMKPSLLGLEKLENFLDPKDKINLSKLNRSNYYLPECSHPLTILGTVYLFLNSNKLPQNKQGMAFLALPTGSTELGIVLHHFFNQKFNQDLPNKLYFAPISLHNGKGVEPNMKTLDLIQERQVVLIDDNVSSGRTVEVVVDYLADKSVEVAYVIAEADIVRSNQRGVIAKEDYYGNCINKLTISTTLEPGKDLKKKRQRTILSREYEKESRNFTNGSIDHAIAKIKSEVVENPTHREVRKNQDSLVPTFRRTFLSNFWPVPVNYNGLKFPSVEHAYQYAKFVEFEKAELSLNNINQINNLIDQRNSKNNLTENQIENKKYTMAEFLVIFTKAEYSPGTIKILTNYLRSLFGQTQNWRQNKLKVMYQLLLEKFKDPDVRRKLLETEDKLLVEGNTWNDTFWGYNGKIGNNYLGRMLMLLRDFYKQTQEVSGFVFDLDETLIKPSESEINSELVQIIAQKIKNDYPVVFASGRSYKSIIKRISSLLKNLSNNELSLITVASNNGAVISKVERVDNNQEYSQKVLVEHKLENSQEIFDYILNKYNGFLLKDDHGENTSKARTNSISLEFQKVFSKEGFARFAEKLNNELIEGNFECKILISNHCKIDLVNLKAGKLEAVKTIDPKYSQYASFGDQGDKFGNDSDILSLPLSFDVSKSLSGPEMVSLVLNSYFVK